MTTKQITITATSGGYVGGDKAQIDLDGTEIGFGSYSRGLNVAVFEETTGKPLFCTTFDTGIGTSDVFADSIDRLPEGRIVAVAVKGDAAFTPLTDKAKAAFKSIGSQQIDQLEAWQSYALIGIKGHDPGTARESINWSETSTSYNFDAEVVKVETAFTVSATSVPAPSCKSEITVNGSVVAVEGGYGSGFNLAVIDRKTAEVKTTANFDIAADPSKMAEFAQLIENLNPGEIVALSTMGDVSIINYYLRGKKACNAIGSRLIDNGLGYGGSWAIVGYKGAKPGKAVENLNNIGQYLGNLGLPVAVKYWELLVVPFSKELQLRQKLSPDGASDAFGSWRAVAIDGDYAIVGDYIKGNAYIYQWQDGQWQQQQQLHCLAPQAAKFGVSVDINGNFVIVGQYNADASDDRTAGAAHIYQLKGGRWEYQQLLQPSDLKAADYFGISVEIHDKVAIVGGFYADAPGKENCSAAYIFQLSGDKWVQKAKLQPDDLGASDRFGIAVSIDDSVAIVGSCHPDTSGKNDCGAAYVFQLQGGEWQLHQKVQSLDLSVGARDNLCQKLKAVLSKFFARGKVRCIPNDDFGYAVAIRDKRAIVGAYNSDVSGKEHSGAAYIFQLEDGQWQLHQKIQSNDPIAGGHFGGSVDILGDVAVVGASGYGGYESGTVYLFQLVNGTWVQQQKLAPLERKLFGRSVAFDGSRAIVGGEGFAYIGDVVKESPL